MYRERLGQERRKRSLTQAQVARELGISTVYLRKLENGQANPGRELSFKFEQFYGLMVKELFPDLYPLNKSKCLHNYTSSTLLNQQVFPTFVLDCEGTVILWNRACANLTGINEEEIIGTRDYRLAFYENHDYTCLAELVLSQDPQYCQSYRVCRVDTHMNYYYAERWVKTIHGSRYFIITATPIYGETGGLVAVSESLIDITDNKLTEDKFGLAGQVFENSPEGVMVTDQSGQIIWTNPAFTTITGYSQWEVMGKKPRILSSGKHDSLFYENMWTEITKKGKWQGELWDRRKNGEIYPQWTTIISIKDDLNSVHSYVSVFSDVSKLKNTTELQFIKQLSLYDSLTGLPNRTFFTNTLHTMLSEKVEKKEKLAVLLLDIDRFKFINDTLGHSKGDYLLHDIATLFKQCLTEEQTIARMSGDEFAFVVPNSNEEKITDFANQLLSVLVRPYYILGQKIDVTASIGVSQYPMDGKNVETLIGHAETALYQAKEKGSNSIQFYNEEVNQKIQKRLHLEHGLKVAIDRSEFELLYQPLVDAGNFATKGFEALIRWNHKERGVLSPLEFIPMAQESGWIEKIDEWVIRQACQQITKWKKHNHTEMHVSVNVSPFFFQQKNVVKQLMPIFKQTSVDPNLLIFEITEDALMQNISNTTGTLKELKKLGIRISIDDFGTGYSSLNYIKELPIDTIKIDKTFIRDVVSSDKDQAIVKAIVTLAKSLNLKIVAEGVEQLVQAEFLSDLGCDLLQGYLFAKPLPIQDATCWFSTIQNGEANPLLV